MEVEEEVDEEVEEEVDEEEEADAEMELEEFPYNGKMYYKDGENNIYMLNSEGEPVAVGRFDPLKNRILKVTNV